VHEAAALDAADAAGIAEAHPEAAVAAEMSDMTMRPGNGGSPRVPHVVNAKPSNRIRPVSAPSHR